MAMQFQRGDTIGLYKIEAVLGSGGMGRVYKARHRITGRVEALKVVLREGPSGAERTKRFFQEVRTQASMNHAGIPAVHNAFWEGDALVVAMELIEGQSLERLIKDRPISLPEGLGYVLQVLDVLSHVHARNVVHRDVSPGNIMVGWDGKIRLTDFGLAKVTTDERPSETGVVMGAVYYMSPEQVRGDASIDQRTDLYSLGIVLYELLTGKKPFGGDNHYSIMRAHVEQEPVMPMEINPSISPALSRAISTAIAKEPSRRFQSASQFREVLERTREGVRQDAWNPTSMWEGISGVFQNLLPTSAPFANSNRRGVILEAPSSVGCGASNGSGPAPLPPALRELATTLSCLSGSARR
jgi:serine/threonine-protein kinase